MTKGTLVLYEEMEKLLDRTATDLLSTLVNLSGSLKDIAYGTHIKIPTDAGYVKFYKSHDSWNLSCWLSQNLQEKTETETSIDEMLTDDGYE